MQTLSFHSQIRPGMLREKLEAGLARPVLVKGDAFSSMPAMGIDTDDVQGVLEQLEEKTGGDRLVRGQLWAVQALLLPVVCCGSRSCSLFM